MDLFYDNINILEKKRIHFNEFMLNINKQLHDNREVNLNNFHLKIYFN